MGDVAALGRGEPQLVEVGALPQSGETQALLFSDVRYYKVVPMIAGGELLGSKSSASPISVSRRAATARNNAR
jgi:hypothetical protein